MSQSSLVLNWVNQFTDPFAVLGVSVTADDQRVQKRYRNVAKQLHPDRFTDADTDTKDLTNKLLSRLINPIYEKIRQEKEREENRALLRLRVRRLTRDGSLAPQYDIARQLMECPVPQVDGFYEQAIVSLAETQFRSNSSFANFASVTPQLMELNLVYLQLKMGDVEGGIHEKRTGLIAANAAKPKQFTPVVKNSDVASESYDQRHYRRAQEYAKKGAWHQVTQELRDAIKIKADKSEYHALLGVAYLHLEKPLPGMAKVHLKRALELNPTDVCATKFAPKVGLVVSASETNQANGKHSTNGTKSPQPTTKRGGLFGLFGQK